MEKTFLQFNKAFTLAEVLITLVIIGVVAAMTIPTLINNTKKQEYVAGCKKAYSVLSQALYKIGQNNGYPVGDYTFFSEENIIDEFSKVLSVFKICDSFNECSGKSIYDYKYLNNDLNNHNVSDGRTIITNDGQMYSMIVSYGGTYGISSEDNANTLARILVDVNGSKNPNQFGYDTFIFYIVNGKGIVPAGGDAMSSCNKSNSGTNCAARVLKENAINY